MKDPNKILDDEVMMQNYGVVAEISEESFRETVGNRDYSGLIARKKMENDSIMAGLEVINETKSLLHKSDPRELQVLSQL